MIMIDYNIEYMFHLDFYLTNYFQNKIVEHFEKEENLSMMKMNYIDRNHYITLYSIENRYLLIVHQRIYILIHLVDYPRRHYQRFDELFHV
jgi:hypothetical protein